jgi:membrane associated rhomboid family serine protease
MREAPVGWQCAQCVHRDAKAAPVTRWRPQRAGTLGTSRMTPLVMTVVAINVVIFLIEETNINSIAYRFALIPVLTTHERYRLVTAAFLHANIEHIFLNMISLIIIGPAVETAFGRVRFVALYLLAAVGGEVCSYLLASKFEESLGASGAIFGLLGAYYVVATHRGWDRSIVVPLIVINLIFSFLDPQIDWHAHVGGLLVGGVVAVIYEYARGRPVVTQRTIEVCSCLALFAVIAALSYLPPGHVSI